jgi:hypothetical protein
MYCTWQSWKLNFMRMYSRYRIFRINVIDLYDIRQRICRANRAVSSCSYIIYFALHDYNCNVSELYAFWNFWKMSYRILLNAKSVGPHEKSITLQHAQTFKFWTKIFKCCISQKFIHINEQILKKRLLPIKRTNFSWDLNTWEKFFLVYFYRNRI